MTNTNKNKKYKAEIKYDKYQMKKNKKYTIV